MEFNGIKGIEPLFPSLFEKTDKVRQNDEIKIPFADYLKNAVNDTNNLLMESEKISADFAAGRTDNIHQVMIAGEKAEVALQFTMQIRNKILDAYNEIMRMQI